MLELHRDFAEDVTGLTDYTTLMKAARKVIRKNRDRILVVGDDWFLGMEGPSGCDDGNLEDGDGCSSQGFVEYGYKCDHETLCSPFTLYCPEEWGCPSHGYKCPDNFTCFEVIPPTLDVVDVAANK